MATVRSEKRTQIALDVPVFVENDANGAALAELSFGRRAGQSDLCLLFLDIGVGAGMIFDRKIFHGSDGLAGEIGHLCLDPDQNRQAEERGILETQLGRDSVLAAYRQAGGKARNFEVFLRDLKKEKPLAQKTVRRWREWLTLAIGNLADLSIRHASCWRELCLHFFLSWKRTLNDVWRRGTFRRSKI